jgi:hypothetical protein
MVQDLPWTAEVVKKWSSGQYMERESLTLSSQQPAVEPNPETQ